MNELEAKLVKLNHINESLDSNAHDMDTSLSYEAHYLEKEITSARDSCYGSPLIIDCNLPLARQFQNDQQGMNQILSIFKKTCDKVLYCHDFCQAIMIHRRKYHRNSIEIFVILNGQVSLKRKVSYRFSLI